MAKRLAPRMVALAGLLGAALVGMAPAVPAAAEQRCVQPGSALKPLPWAQSALDPGRVWPFSTGAGVTVAVVDTGVDATHPQLRGHVQTGTDVADGKGGGNADCVGHGTGVAGVIAAQRASGLGFAGLAPGASILPVAVTPAGDGQAPDHGTADPALLAKGIDWAVAHQARVVAVPLVSYADSGQLRQAVQRAVDGGALVVAAGGDQGSASDGNPTPYPAAYPGVLGVGAIGSDGTVWSSSQHGDYVDLVAPGVNVVTTQAGGGLVSVSGTGYATGFAAAVAALAWQAWPQLDAAQLATRLEATAAPAAEAPGGPHYGYGIADPYRAVTDRVASTSPRALPAVPAGQRNAAARWRARQWADSSTLAGTLTAAGLGAGLLLVAAAVLVPQARRGRWRAGQVAPPHDDPEADLPSPPVQLFHDPAPTR